VRNFVKLFSLVMLFVVAVALFPPALHAQRWVYVNDNNPANGGNTVTGFVNAPLNKLLPIAGSPWPTGGTGLGNTLAVKNQALYTLGTGTTNACLFISNPAPQGTGFPNGDIAVFNVNTVTGALTAATPPRYASYHGFSGNHAGIPLATGGKALYAAWTLSNMIEVWAISVNTPFNCTLIPSTSVHNAVAAIGLHGGFVEGMSEAHNYKDLAVAYGDGSIQAFKTAGLGIGPACAASNSTGFTDGNLGLPSGVDITQDSKYAIFGDSSATFTNVTELETEPLPFCGTVSKDFGGPIGASATNLGPAVDASNVWLSPGANTSNGTFIYVANAGSGQITTVNYLEGPDTMALAGIAPVCTAGHTNPTALHNSGTWTRDAGIQTSATTGTGKRIYVAEYGSPSSVALLQVDASGCTKESAFSPFADLSSINGALSLNAWPARPF
jgi:hypothetical protein